MTKSAKNNSKKIQALTSEDYHLTNKVAKEWVAIGVATGPANREVSEAAINEAYTIAGLRRPSRIEWFRSPNEAIFRLNALFPSKKDSFLSECCFGLHDAHWLGYSQFFIEWNKVTMRDIPGTKSLITLAKEIGWWWPYDDVCIVTERPVAIHRDEAGRLHAEDNMAIEYSDGWGVYSWHGYRIANHLSWIITDKARLNPTVIEEQKNAELRRVMLEIYGFSKYLEERKATLISEDIDGAGNPRRLYQISIASENIRVIELLNSSLEPDGTRRKFHLGAMPGKTPHEAVAASFGFNSDTFKEAVCS